MKFYVISGLAQRQTKSPDETTGQYVTSRDVVSPRGGRGPYVRTEHAVDVFYDENMDDVASQAKPLLLEKWPINEGWFNHSVVILSYGTEKFYELVLRETANGGVFDVGPPEYREFPFGPPPPICGAGFSVPYPRLRLVGAAGKAA